MNTFKNKFTLKNIISLLWFFSSFLMFLLIWNTLAVLDFTSDNTIWYMKDLVFTSDSKTPTATNSKIIVKWTDGSISLSWNLNIWKWLISDNTIFAEDIKDWNIVTPLLTDNSVTYWIIKNNTILSNSISSLWVESVDIKNKVIEWVNFDFEDNYYFNYFKDHTNSWYLLDLSNSSYLLDTIVNILKINNAKLDKLVIWWDVTWNYEVEIDWDWKVEWRLCNNNICWWDKPKEIWIMNDNKRCIWDWTSIQCNK